MGSKIRIIDNIKDFDFSNNALDATGDNVVSSVKNIIADVKKRGDVAVFDYTQKFDNNRIDAESIRLDFSDVEIAEELKNALDTAYQRIKSYHEKQLPKDEYYKDETGTKLGWKYYPIESVGLYVPGGLASYPSSVLMSATVAKVAGVKKIVMVMPTPGGKVNPLTLYAAKIAGVDEIYQIGGAQAIAALAYGTKSVPKVDKIFGPGNAYVAEAKRQVFGAVGIDMIAGPSEILVISDNKTNPEWLAYDLLSQAEHDVHARSFLITDDAEFAKQVEEQIEVKLSELARKDIAIKSWQENGEIFVVKDLKLAGVELANKIAAEHLELCVDDPESYLDLLTTSGAIFMGRYTPEAIGDYIAGPSHILPTFGTARFASGLGVSDFLRRSSLINCSKESFKKLSKQTAKLADAESLECHALSVTIREE